MRCTLFLFLFFKLSAGFGQAHSDNIVGVWMSDSKDLKVQVFKSSGKYYGKIIWFLCKPDEPTMEEHLDGANPNPKLRTRPWLGLLSLQNLIYEKDNIWTDGKVYDPNTGRTFSATVKLVSNNKLQIRGYWGLEILGKNLTFYKV